MKNLLCYASGASILAISLTVGLAGNANAAALQGRVGINPPGEDGVESGVVFTGTGIIDPNGNPLTDFDFTPPTGGDVGAVVEINANPFNGFDDFASFVGNNGTIQDVTAEELLALGGLDDTFTPTGEPTPIPNFIEFPDAFSFTLEGVSAPQYSFNSGDTTVTISAFGKFINLSDGSLDESNGRGTFSVDFAGKSIAETRALFDMPGEVPDEFNPGTWSSNFVAFSDNPPEVVPEASNLLGLLAVGLVGSGSLFKRKIGSRK
ncbi:exported hypothetical protein [Hyella patelloides LEGE 07179]|uniref:PEP-CTERM protein-sorting domain-containing protein n=1 Tax=Hyella patelloides LEGE 07179 TaxID=945734 RepID=A0A563VPQ7_9CYAN|nr:hypothetical protein [Hyella patelloides]VEP13267.1 exported hypothetical protein [Hyella patelloides LEGE 07179]